MLPVGWHDDDEDYPTSRILRQNKSAKLDWARTPGHTTGTTYPPGTTAPPAPPNSTFRYYPTNFRVAWATGKGDYQEDDESSVIAYAENHIAGSRFDTPDRAIIQ